MISQHAGKLVQKIGRRQRPDNDVAAEADRQVLLTRFDVATRAEAISLDHAGADASLEFKALAAAADRSRDDRNWGEAEFLYWQALELFPLHSGYRVQYAHVIKEQGKYDWAEVHYRSALAEGAAANLVDEHLQFCTRQNHFKYAPLAPYDFAVSPFHAPPSFHDLQTLAWVFWHDSEINSHDALFFMRECQSNREVVLRMTEHDRFLSNNRPFLEMLRK